MPRWLRRTLARIHALSASGAFRLTHKAESEALRLGCSAADVRDIVGSLTASDFHERLTSKLSGEWMYIFAPQVADTTMYVKIVLRAQCVVVSFHEDEASQTDA